MGRTALRSGAAAVVLLGGSALGIGADAGAGRQNSLPPEPATTGQGTTGRRGARWRG